MMLVMSLVYTWVSDERSLPLTVCVGQSLTCTCATCDKNVSTLDNKGTIVWNCSRQIEKHYQNCLLCPSINTSHKRLPVDQPLGAAVVLDWASPNRPHHFYCILVPLGSLWIRTVYCSLTVFIDNN